MKKISVWILFILMTCLAFSGCGAKPPSSETFADEDLKQTINANISTNTTATISMAIGATDAEELIARALIDAFNVKYPNITVNLTKVGGSYLTMLSAMIPAGTMPDLFWIDPANLGYYSENGVSFAMDNYIKDSGLNLSLYNSNAINMGKNKSGHYYMMPRDYSQIVCYYNQKIFTDAQIAIPSNDWTWDDFLTICKAFQDSGTLNSSYPILDVELDWQSIYYPIIRSFGGEIIDSNGNVVIDENIDSNPESNGAYQYLGTLLDLKSKGIILSTQSSSGASTFFYGKNSPFYFHARPSLSDGIKMLGEDLGVLPMPAIGETPYIGAGSVGYGIYRKSNNKDAAWALLNFMMSQDGQIALSKTGNAIPILLSELNSENPTWKSYPSGANLVQENFLANSERGIDISFLQSLPPSTHNDSLMYLRTMYTNVLYNGANRVSAIRLCSDAMYNLLSYK